MVNCGEGRWSIWRCAVELLEEANVKDVMQASTGRQGEPDGDIIDELDDAVGLVEARFKLSRCSLGQRRGRVVAKTENGPIADLVRDVAMVLVVEALVDRLSLLEPSADVIQKLVALLHRLGSDSHLCITRLIRLD
jgi:hypothetical protein